MMRFNRFHPQPRRMPVQWTTLLLVFLGLMLAVPNIASGQSVRERLERGAPLRIVCLGDSITGIYYHTGGRRAYPEMLALGLSHLYPESDVTVINAGISGHTTRQGRSRLQRDVLAHDPHLVFIAFGMNDVTRLEPTEFRDNLRKIVQQLHEKKIAVILGTPNTVEHTPRRPIERVAMYAEIVRVVGKQTRVPVVDINDVFDKVRQDDPFAFKLLMSDDIHPNMEGHQLIASEIIRELTGKNVDFSTIAPANDPLKRTNDNITAGSPVKILAMEPCDQWIGDALKHVAPDIEIQVTKWSADEAWTSKLSRSAGTEQILNEGYHLVIVTPPLRIDESDADYAERCSAMLNRSLATNGRIWDVIVVPPSTLDPKLNDQARQRDALIQRLAHGKDLPLVLPSPNVSASGEQVLTSWVHQALSQNGSSEPTAE